LATVFPATTTFVRLQHCEIIFDTCAQKMALEHKEFYKSSFGSLSADKYGSTRAEPSMP